MIDFGSSWDLFSALLGHLGVSRGRLGVFWAPLWDPKTHPKVLQVAHPIFRDLHMMHKVAPGHLITPSRPSKMRKRRPKTPPRCPKRALRCPQDAPRGAKVARRGPKTTPRPRPRKKKKKKKKKTARCPRRCQSGQKRPQNQSTK